MTTFCHDVFSRRFEEVEEQMLLATQKKYQGLFLPRGSASTRSAPRSVPFATTEPQTRPRRRALAASRSITPSFVFLLNT